LASGRSGGRHRFREIRIFALYIAGCCRAENGWRTTASRRLSAYDFAHSGQRVVRPKQATKGFKEQTMNTSSSLLFDQFGTATDPATGLIWIVPLVGQGIGGGMAQGSALEFSWDNATTRFGQARHIAATSLDCNWRNQGGDLGGGEKKTHFRRKYPLCRETYQGYVFGKKPYEFAGFRDWRLPTIEPPPLHQNRRPKRRILHHFITHARR
jgi:hypothetical protein